MHVLVAYATKHGATKEIAERIGATLSADGFDATVRSVEDARDLAGYDAFVIGSAAYMGGWLGEATAFVRHNRSILAARPVWLFSSGPIGADKVDKHGRDVLVASQPTQFAEFESAIGPCGTRVFFGAYDPHATPIGLAERVGRIFTDRLPQDALPAGDFRDWPAIEAWAHEIAQGLQAVPAGR